MTPAGEWWPGGPVSLPARVALDGELYEVTARPTHELLHILAASHWPSLLPNGLRPADRLRVARRLYDPADALDLPHLWQAATVLGGRLAGVHVDEGHDPGAAWWPATRLAAMATRHWMSLDGWAAVHGVDLLRSPLSRLIAVTWQFAVEHRPTEGASKDAKQIPVESLRERIWTPPAAHRKQVMKFTPAQERAAALAAIREALPPG